MNGGLNILISQAQTDEKLRRAKTRRLTSASNGRLRDRNAVVRLASEADRPGIGRLSQLEGRRLPPGPALVAEQEGEVLAAVSLRGGDPIADPFRPTAELVELLGKALAHLREDGGRRRWSIWGLLGRSRHGRADGSAPTVLGNELLLIR